MSEVYLTASEIYKIDELNDITILDYLDTVPAEKHELVLHLFRNKRAVKFSDVRLQETEAHLKWLMLEIHEKNSGQSTEAQEKNEIKYA